MRQGRRHLFPLRLLAGILMMLVLACPVAVAAVPKQVKPASAAKPETGKRFVIKYVLINKRRYLPLRSVAEYYKLKYKVDLKNKKAAMSNASGEVAVFTIDSRNFTLKGIQAGLSYPVRLNKGALYLEMTDFQDFLDPIMRPNSIPKRKIRTVMLDAGHGGSDVGAQGGGKNEKDLNLLMVKRVGAILRARGFAVLYTRTTDKTLSLKERTDLAVGRKPDLFISLHCNSIDETLAKTTSGIEIYVANSAGVPSYGGNTIGKDNPGAKFQATNSYWEYLMQSAMLKATKANDRGMKRKQFYVITHTTMPSMLIEMGFISHPSERKNLLSSTYEDKLAVAICDGIGQLEKALRPKGVSAPVPPKVTKTKK